MTSRYQELCESLEAARGRYAAYRSECFFFAGTLSRGLMDFAGWPRELVSYEATTGGNAGQPTDRIEDAIHLDDGGFWVFGLRLSLEVPKGRDSILLTVRFKKIETRYIVSLFGVEDFEVAAPTPEALQPLYESVLNAIKRYYESGLRLFLENGGRGLKIQISTQRLQEMARGAGGAG
jgi:hypothetical protein